MEATYRGTEPIEVNASQPLASHVVAKYRLLIGIERGA